MKKTLNLANSLSLLRLVFGAAFLTFLLTSAPDYALVMFVLAMLTDVADGYVARRLNQVTALGSTLDGIADKIVLSLAFVILALKMHFPVWVMLVPVSYHVFTILGFFLLVKLRKKAPEHTSLAKASAVLQSVVVVIGLTGLIETVFGQLMIVAMVVALILATIRYLQLGFMYVKK